MSTLGALKKYSNGNLDEEALQAVLSEGADIAEYENDPAFIDECQLAATPLILQDMMLEGVVNFDELDENVKEAFNTIQNYMVGQGWLTEAAAQVHINPKINVVHLNKQAQINRLTSIITLKMARRADNKAYRKYKLGVKIKKDNMVQMKKLYGAKAERLAKKLWIRTRKSSKVNSIVEGRKSK